MTPRHWISGDEPEALLSDFLSAVVLATTPGVELPDATIGDLVMDQGLLSFALNRADSFAAARWQFASGGLLDAACLRTADGRVRLLVSERIPADNTKRLVEQLCGLRASVRVAHRPLPSFSELSALLASRGGLNSTSAELGVELLDLRQQLDYYRETLREHADELRQLKAQTRAGQVLFDPVRFASRQEPQAPGTGAAPQRSLADLPDWYARNDHRIVLLPRALNGCKKALYEDADALFAGLEFLAGPFREGRLGHLTKDAVQAALEATGLRIAGSTTSTVAGSQGDAYFVQWLGRRRFMDLHLLKGGGRDERYCLRIYFFWCDESEKVVVGSMPAHLDNSLS